MHRKYKKYKKYIKTVLLLTVFILSAMLLLTGCKGRLQEDKTKENKTGFQEISEDELAEEGADSDANKTDDEITETESSEKTIFIHVCGAVSEPGVYELKADSRVCEAIKAAGGMTEDAAENSLNQAAFLEDGQQLYVLTAKEWEEQKEQSELRADANTDESSTDGKININKASKEELMTLSGIGEAKADAIIRYREENGGFRTIEEIMEIEGIKEGVFHKIKSQIIVS